MNKSFLLNKKSKQINIFGIDQVELKNLIL